MGLNVNRQVLPYGWDKVRPDVREHVARVVHVVDPTWPGPGEWRGLDKDGVTIVTLRGVNAVISYPFAQSDTMGAQ